MPTIKKENKLCNDRKNQTYKWAGKTGFSKEIKVDAVANLWNFLWKIWNTMHRKKLKEWWKPQHWYR